MNTLADRTFGRARHLGLRQPYAQRERHVLVPFVGRAALPGDAQDHQLGVPPRERPERHQPRRVAQPGAEQARVLAERGEDVGRPGPGDPARDRGHDPGQRPQVTGAGRRDAGLVRSGWGEQRSQPGSAGVWRAWPGHPWLTRGTARRPP